MNGQEPSTMLNRYMWLSKTSITSPTGRNPERERRANRWEGMVDMYTYLTPKEPKEHSPPASCIFDSNAVLTFPNDSPQYLTSIRVATSAWTLDSWSYSPVLEHISTGSPSSYHNWRYQYAHGRLIGLSLIGEALFITSESISRCVQGLIADSSRNSIRQMSPTLSNTHKFTGNIFRAFGTQSAIIIFNLLRLFT